MKRIGGLKQQVGAGVHELTVDGRTPHQQIAECYAEIRDFQSRQRLNAEALLAALAPHGISVVSYEELSSEEQTGVRDYYLQQHFPAAHPAGNRPGASVPIRLQPVAESAGYACGTRVRRALAGADQGAGRPRHPPLAPGRRKAIGLSVSKKSLQQSRLALPGYAGRGLRTLSRHAQRQHRARRRKSRRFAGTDRVGIAGPPLCTHRPPQSMALAWIRLIAACWLPSLAWTRAPTSSKRTACWQMRDLLELASLDVPPLHDPPHHPIDHPAPAAEAQRNIFHIMRDVGLDPAAASL